mgnify:CR=1 FL=1
MLYVHYTLHGNAVAYGHYNTSLPESHKIMIALAYTTSPFQCFFIVYHFFIISAIKYDENLPFHSVSAEDDGKLVPGNQCTADTPKQPKMRTVLSLPPTMLSLSLEQINNSYPRVPVQAAKAFYQFLRHTLSDFHLCLSHDGRE